jgi:hypothetical protein
MAYPDLDIPEREQVEYDMDEWDGGTSVTERFNDFTYGLVTVPLDDEDDRVVLDPPSLS